MTIHSDLNSLPISTSTKNNYQYCWYHSKLEVSYFQNCQKSHVKKDLLNTLPSEAVVRWCSSKQMFLKFSQYSQENMRWSLFLKRLQPLRPATLLKKTQTQVFSCEICEIFTSFFTEHLRRLLLFCETLTQYKILLKSLLIPINKNKEKIICFQKGWLVPKIVLTPPIHIKRCSPKPSNEECS